MAFPVSIFELRPDRFKIHAYVCGTGCLKFPDVEGTLTFEMIYVKRPDACRYVVVSQWDIAEHTERIAVFDLYAVHFKGKTKRIIMPKPKLTCWDLDQAIAATMLLYEGEA